MIGHTTLSIHFTLQSYDENHKYFNKWENLIAYVKRAKGRIL